MYVYQKGIEQPGYNVGWFTKNNEWIIESIWGTKAEAAARTSYLNGGKFFGEQNELITIIKSNGQCSYLDTNDLKIWRVLKTKITRKDCSARVFHILMDASIETFGDLVQYKKNDLLKFRNFGKKSVAVVDSVLLSKGLSFEMDVSKYRCMESLETNPLH